MRKLILIAVVVALVPLFGYSEFTPYQSDGRIVQTYQYDQGIQVSAYSNDDDSYTIFQGGNRVKSYYADAPEDAFFTATYENGVIVSSYDQYGNETLYDDFGRKLSSEKSGVSYDEAGNVITGEESSMTTYEYDEYGRMVKSVSQVADVDANGDLTGTFSDRETTYVYEGRTLLYITDSESANITHFSGDEIYVTNQDGTVISRTLVDDETGRKATVYYEGSSGLATGYSTYDKNNRQDKTYDTVGGGDATALDGGVLTMSINYQGAHVYTQETYKYDENGTLVDTVVTSFDHFGNKWITTSETSGVGLLFGSYGGGSSSSSSSGSSSSGGWTP